MSLGFELSGLEACSCCRSNYDYSAASIKEYIVMVSVPIVVFRFVVINSCTVLWLHWLHYRWYSGALFPFAPFRLFDTRDWRVVSEFMTLGLAPNPQRL